jgi:hypothetical protein
MIIEQTADSLVIRLPLRQNMEEVQRFLNYLRYKELIAESKATQSEIDHLAKSVNQNWWAQNKQRFLPE